jgi:hypothetical protein
MEDAMKKIALGAGAAALMFGACAEGPQNTTDDFGYDGTGIQVSIAPLTLDSISDACYSFSIVNEANDLVVARGPQSPAAALGGSGGSTANSVCASQFGNSNGGDISYVAPCDAQEEQHTVTLWVDALCDNGSGDATGWDAAGTTQYEQGEGICAQIQDYVNPCGTAGCALPVTCQENADTPVTFNFTIMGQADQGFFDVAVNFDDVFCSAKMDTCSEVADNDSSLRPIQMIFDGSGNRMNTLVLAVACTAGPGAGVTTVLTHTALSVDCGPAGGANLDLETIDAEGTFVEGGLRWAAYFGTEQLPGANKVYTNIAVGIPDGALCDVDWDVVPSNGDFADPSAANTYNSFGFIRFEAKDLPSPVVDGAGAVTGCTQLSLDGLPNSANAGALGSSVTTLYASTGGTTSEALPAFLSQITEGNSDDIVEWVNLPNP